MTRLDVHSNAVRLVAFIAGSLSVLILDAQTLPQAKLDTIYSVQGNLREKLERRDGQLVLVRFDSLYHIVQREEVVLALDTTVSITEGNTLESFVVSINYAPMLLRHGSFTEYWPKGHIRTQGRMCDGFKCGEWIEFNPDGSVLSRKTFQRGILLITR